MFKTMLGFVIGVIVTVIIVGGKDEGWVIPPIPDPGHRLYGTVSERGAAAVLDVLAKSNVHPKMAFDAGPTHQVVLDDGQRTVIAWFDQEAGALPKDAISLAADDPVGAAQNAATIFNAAGFPATTKSFPVPDGVLAVVSSKAFTDGGIVYRPPWYKMRMPPSRPLPRPN